MKAILVAAVACALRSPHANFSTSVPRRHRARPPAAAGAAGPRVAVTRDSYANATAAAVAAVRRVASRLSLGCSIALRGEEIVVSVGGADYVAGRDALPAAAVGDGGAACRVGPAGGAEARVAVYTVVDTVEYLVAPGNREAFVNKARFCERTKRSFFVVLVGPGDASLHARDPLPWQACGEPEGRNQLSVYKAPGALRLFEADTGAKFLLYLDADAWFADGSEAAALEAYGALLDDRGADLMGVQNRYESDPGAAPGGRPRKIVMNGGVFLLRRGAFADDLAGLWWRGRCGPKDQLPLWVALFSHWHVAQGAPYDPAHFETYKLARRAALPALSAAVGAARLPRGQLDAAVVVGNVLLLPALPVGDLPALRSDQDWTRRTFVCHTKPGRPEQRGQCDAADVCARARCEAPS